MDNGQKEREIGTGNKVQSFVFPQLKDAFEQDCCQLWKTIFLWKKIMPVTTELQELSQCVLYTFIPYYARLIVWSIVPSGVF